MSSTTTTTTTTAATVHILVFPYPAQGHMLPLLELTHQLLLHGGFKITILVTPKNLPILNPLLSTHPNSIETLVLPFPHHPNLPLGVENVKDIGNSGNAPIIASLSKLEGEFIQWFQSHHFPPQAILSDFFLGWTQNWAEKLKIPRIGFFSSGAFATCVLTHLLPNMDTLQKLEIVDFPDMPRSISLPKNHLPSIFKRYRKGDSKWELVRESLIANSKSWATVFNSFYALEGEYLDHMKRSSSSGSGHGRVYGVGPLGPSAESLKRANPDCETSSYVINWLDKCANDSVLYVCFGSQKVLTMAQIEALKLGLERSKTNFIWVVKSMAEEDHGFENRVANRGLVVRGWAPQMEILSHKAVGGFLSHCGWNSLLEGLLAGVMFLAWPMEADQFLNARLLVDDLGLAVRVCEGEDTGPDPNDLARTISEYVGSNLPERDRAKVMRQKAFEAVKAGGSSYMDLDELVKELNQIQVPNTC